MKNRGFLMTAKRALLIPCLILCVSAFILSGCSEKAAADGKSQKGYSLPEIMVIAMAEKKRYEDVCTDQIWGVEVPGEDSDFAEYLTEQIKSFMDEMKMMSLLAAEKNIVLSAEESAAMSAAAAHYYERLTKEDISQMGVTRENALQVFEDYCLANKLVEELTKEVNLEVSDSEAKVITIIQAQADSREAALNLKEAASQEKADFQRCAEDAGLSVLSRQLGKAEESKDFEDAVFNLVTGEVSDVIEKDGSFYVVKCVNDYDEEATKERKETVFKERKRMAFEEIYVNFEKEVNLTYSGEPWEKLNLSGKTPAKGADFFEIYEQYAP